jgi:hypothetical protein
MLISDIAPYKNLFEVISFSPVENDVLKLKGSYCYQYLPVGNVDKSFFRDKIFCNDINIFDYVIHTKYYAYYKPVSYDLFNRYFNLGKEVIQTLKNKQINVYEVELIMGGCLQDMGGFRNITTEECYSVQRINNVKLNIQTPPNLFTDNEKVIIILNSYYPNCLYILD